MPTIDDAINSGDVALNNLYALQTAAMKQGNLAAQKALADDIDGLTYKLTQLRGMAITANDSQIAALNAQLDKVTSSAKASLAQLDNLTKVLNDVVLAAKLIDSIIGLAIKA